MADSRRTSTVKRFFRAAFLVALAACTRKASTPAVQIAMVSQRDIIIDAQANGVIEPIDTRDVQNQYDQAKAALDAAQVKLTTSEASKKRSEELLKARVITPQEFEQVTVDYETAKSSVVGAQAMLDQRKLALEDATVKAPQEGTVITKSVAEGTVIASASGSVSGG